MYGSVRSVADFVTASAAFVDVPGLALHFKVEEDEMLVQLELNGVAFHTAADSQVHLQFELDGAPVDAAAASGQWGGTSATASALLPVRMAFLARGLAKGDHVLKAQIKTPDGASATLNGAAFPADLSAWRVTADAALAHGVDSKVQAIF